MEASLRASFDRLEERKRLVLRRLEGVPEATLNRSPGEGRWSILQVLAHLCRAEDLSLRHIRKTSGAAAPPAGWGSALRSALLSLALRSPLKFTAPPLSAEVPERTSLPEVAAAWEVVRRELEATLAELPPGVARRAIFRHPRAGMLSPVQALRFMEEHFDHHLRQVDRLLAAGA